MCFCVAGQQRKCYVSCLIVVSGLTLPCLILFKIFFSFSLHFLLLTHLCGYINREVEASPGSDWEVLIMPLSKSTRIILLLTIDAVFFLVELTVGM